ncbi:ABC transporter ATP-binding protein [Streptomyces sp. e14]|nr:ABC transporter ATP-binding protein [Streptomyces sp. e14]
MSTRVAQALRPGDDVVCAVRGLTKTYPAARGRRGTPGTPEVRATDDVALDVRRGEIFGLLGPNGAGKSTLVRQLTGLMRPDHGTVEILGHDIVAHPERAARLLAYLGQEAGALDELTVSLAAETTGRLRGLDVARARAERDAVLEELGLTAIAGRALKKLSGGQRRARLLRRRAGRRAPACWCWTSPTTGMDPVCPGAGVVRRRPGGAPNAARPSCWSPTTSSRPRRSSTGSPSSTAAGSSPATPRPASRSASPARCGSSWCGGNGRRWRCRRLPRCASGRWSPGAAGRCAWPPRRPVPPWRR